MAEDIKTPTMEDVANYSGQFLRKTGGTISGDLTVDGAFTALSSGFHVHKNGTDQTGMGTGATLLTWSTEEYDTDNDFSSNRHTPSRAGYWLYSINIVWSSANNDSDTVQLYLLKNGSTYKITQEQTQGGAHGMNFTTTTEMNGTTDYMEAFANNASAAARGVVLGDFFYTFFSGAYLGAA